MTDPIRILVVDDEPDLELLIRQMFRRQIRDGGILFSFAGDGIEALEELDKDPDVDIVLSDINMPRMDGLSLLAKIRDLDRHVKVIIVSAYGDMDNIRTAMNRGAFDFITKPISFDDLTITIEKTHRDLQIHREAREVQQQLVALQRELDIASKIQLSMLPSAFPAFPEQKAFELYATMIPAQEVGGDLYDCFMLEDGRLGFAVGDVAGKGLGSALFMAITRTIVRATAQRGQSPGECIRSVNRALFPETVPRMFVTLIYGVLDPATGEVSLCNAGHNAPYLVPRDGSVEAIRDGRGLALCLMPDFEYSTATLTLRPGDTLVLHSDGVTEARDPDREQFEDERLELCLEHSRGAQPSTIIRNVLRAVEAFADGTPRPDDVTLLALKYNGGSSAGDGAAAQPHAQSKDETAVGL